MKTVFLRITSLLFLLSIMIVFYVVAQLAFAISESDCFDLNYKLTRQSDKDYCENVLNQKLQEAKQLENKAQQEQKTQQNISGEINRLESEIKTLQDHIKSKNNLIKNLSSNISQRKKTIVTLEDKIGREKVSLAKILRKQYETDSITIFEILLSEQTISEFFSDTQQFSYVQDSLQESFGTIRSTQDQARREAKRLAAEKTQQEVVKYELEQDKKSGEQKKSEHKFALLVSEQNEQEYWAKKRQREAEAEIIRNKLFPLLGIEGGGIPFGTALQYANQASKATGIKPALILAILKQESNLGKNVGTCNRPGDLRTWKTIMPGPVHYANYLANGKTCSKGKSPCSWRDDQTTYKNIVGKLGLPTAGTPLSCPISSGTWGGAMGPSQFIPATWKLYEEKIKAIVGITPNPWNAYHAITATALLLKDNGGVSDPLNASCKYYSGSGCYVPGIRNLFYGQAVVSLMAEIQKDIDALEL